MKQEEEGGRGNETEGGQERQKQKCLKRRRVFEHSTLGTV